MSDPTIIAILIIVSLTVILPILFKNRYKFLIEAVKHDTFNKRMAFNSIKYFFFPASSIGSVLIAYFNIGHWTVSFIPLFGLIVVVAGITLTLTYGRRPSDKEKRKLESSISQLFSFKNEQEFNVVDELKLIAKNLKYTADNYFELALSEIGLKNYDTANLYLDFSISNFLKLNSQDSQLKECYFQKGNVLHNLNRFHDSIFYFKKVLEIDNTDLMALNNLGATYNRLGELDKSFEAFYLCYQKDPNNPNYATNLAFIHHSKGNYSEELRLLNEVLSKHPSNVNALVNKGYLFSKQKIFKEALNCFNSALIYQPYNYLILVNKAICHGELEQYHEAYTSINKALEINPNDSNALLTKSSVCMYLNLTDEGLRAINHAIALDPNNSDIWNSVGFYWMAYNEFEKAIEAFNRSIVLNPKNAKAWDNKGNALSRLGLQKESSICKSEAIKLDSRYANRG